MVIIKNNNLILIERRKNMNEKDLRFEAAELEPSMVEKVKTFENEINKNIAEDIVVVAYQKKRN